MKTILVKKHDLTGAPLQWCHNKNCCVTPGFSRFENTAKKPWVWFYPFWVPVATEQRDNVTLCSNHSSVNVFLYPRRRWQIWQHKKILALGPYSELCQGELATQVLRNIFKISWCVKTVTSTEKLFTTFVEIQIHVYKSWLAAAKRVSSPKLLSRWSWKLNKINIDLQSNSLCVWWPATSTHRKKTWQDPTVLVTQGGGNPSHLIQLSQSPLIERIKAKALSTEVLKIPDALNIQGGYKTTTILSFFILTGIFSSLNVWNSVG